MILPLNPKALEHIDDINPTLVSALNKDKNGKIYSFPYMWGTTGIGYNARMLHDLGVDTDHISWKLFFDPAVLAKTSECGIGVINDRDEIIGAALIYDGQSLNSADAANLKLAGQTLVTSVPKFKYLHSMQYVDDLNENKICLTVGYSGDILSLTEDNPDIHCAIPDEGTNVWVDTMVIPANSHNAAIAHKFINFLSEAEVAGRNSNYNAYPTPMLSAGKYVDPELLDDPDIYPDNQMLAHLEALSTIDSGSRRIRQRIWVRAICAGRSWCMSPMETDF